MRQSSDMQISGLEPQYEHVPFISIWGPIFAQIRKYIGKGTTFVLCYAIIQHNM